MNVRIPLTTIIALAAALAAASGPAAAATPPGLPPAGKVMLGLGGVGARMDEFDTLTRAQHKVHLESYAWRSGRDWHEALDPSLEAAENGNFRVMIHLAPDDGNGGEALTPRDAANGVGDAYLIRLSFLLNSSGQVVYVRPPGEMNGHWNPWCAFDESGRRRGASHAASQYRSAFQRMSLIMRGGLVENIDAALAVRGMPALRTRVERIPSSGRIAMVFNPQGRGAPNVSGNQPQDYYPGRRAVDYVANDIYAQSGRAAWADNDRLYSRYQAAHPYIVAEYAAWGYDDPAFLTRMFSWVASHPRTVGLMYFQGRTTSPFRLENKRRSLAVYRDKARQPRYRCPGLGPFRRAC